LRLRVVRALARFMREHPMIRVELSFSSRVVDLVQEGFDLAIRVGHLRDSSLIARRIGDETLGLFASAEYLQRHGRPRTPAGLAEHDLILFRSPTGGHVWRDSLVLDRGGRSHRAAIHGRLELDEILFVRDAVAAGIGIGIIPIFLRHARLVRVLPGYVISAAPVFIVTPTPKFAPERVVRLREFLIDQLGRVLRPSARRHRASSAAA
jgi:DNA-binding transcriptional LysR family regulator